MTWVARMTCRTHLPGSVLVAALFALSAPAMADEIAENLESALASYRDGNLPEALAEVEEARRLMLEIARPNLVVHLPEAPDGWTRSIDAQMSASLAAMGGGTGAEAVYERDGERVSLVIVADSPMATAMAGLFSSPELLATAGANCCASDGRPFSTMARGCPRCSTAASWSGQRGPMPRRSCPSFRPSTTGRWPLSAHSPPTSASVSAPSAVFIASITSKWCFPSTTTCSVRGHASASHRAWSRSAGRSSAPTQTTVSTS